MIDENTTPQTAEQIAQIRENAANAEHPGSWVWDESAVSWTAPVALPMDGFPYLWDENITNWTPFPGYPR